MLDALNGGLIGSTGAILLTAEVVLGEEVISRVLAGTLRQETEHTVETLSVGMNRCSESVV